MLDHYRFSLIFTAAIGNWLWANCRGLFRLLDLRNVCPCSTPADSGDCRHAIGQYYGGQSVVHVDTVWNGCGLRLSEHYGAAKVESSQYCLLASW